MSHRPAERLKISNEVVTISSAAGINSNIYYMGDAYKISFIVGMGTAAASTATAPTIAVNQHPDIAGATAAAIAGATGSFGPSTAFQVEGAQRGVISITTATTLAEILTLTVGGVAHVLTYSTTPSTVATALSFGTTLGSTGAAGAATLTNSLSSVINNSTLSQWITATTISTAAVRLTLNDSAISTGGFSALSTGANITPSYEKSQSIVEVLSEDMNTSSEYVSLAITSADTAVQFSVAVIKEGMRYQPPSQPGQHVKTT